MNLNKSAILLSYHDLFNLTTHKCQYGLEPARFLMTVAFYVDAQLNQDSDWLEKLVNDDLGETDTCSRAAKCASDTTTFFEQLNNSPDRSYHTAQHPMVQLMNQWAQKWLEDCKKSSALIFEYQPMIAFLKRQFKNMKAEFLSGGMSDEIAHASAIREIKRTCGLMCLAMVHDCLYQLGAVSINHDTATQTEQFKLLSNIKKNCSTVGDVLKKTRFESGSLSINFGEKIAKIAKNDFSAGELAAIFMFPYREGGINKKAPLEGPGFNEWCSAVFAINKQNEFRRMHQLPELSLKEALYICVSVAATIPFQPADQLQQLAITFQQLLENKPALKEELVIADEDVDSFVDKVVTQAGRLANNDVGNFASSPQDLRDGDIAVATEFGAKRDEDDAVKQFQLAFNMFKKHSDTDDLEQFSSADLNPDELFGEGKTAGFIRQQAKDGRLFHAYVPLHSDEGISQTEADGLTKQYHENAQILAVWNLYEAAYQLQQLAKEIFGDPSLDDAFKVSLGLSGDSSILMQTYPKLASFPTPEDNINMFEEMKQLATGVFSSDFWKKNKQAFIGPDAAKSTDDLKSTLATGAQQRLDQSQVDGGITSGGLVSAAWEKLSKVFSKSH